MISRRKLRVVGLATFSILLIMLLYKSISNSESVTPRGSNTKTLLTSNSLIESKNDDKLDTAINNEILKLGEEQGQTVEQLENKDDGLTIPKASSDSMVKFDPAKEFIQIRSLTPMTIFSKTYCPYSKRVKKLLHDSYQITPEPTIVELDKHKHGAELQEYLGEITGRNTVPNILVGESNDSKGGCDDFVKLHEEGELLHLLKEWGTKKLDVKKIEPPSNI